MVFEHLNCIETLRKAFLHLPGLVQIPVLVLSCHDMYYNRKDLKVKGCGSDY
jgi:hypothetical protein